MAEGDLYINCVNDPASAEDLLRLVCVDSDGNLYIDCDNDELSWEDLWRLLIVEDASGNPAIAVTGCSGGGGGATIENGVASVTNGVAYPVTFGTAFSDTSYSLHINIYGSGGASVGFTLDAKTAAGFTITPSANGTINWSAIKE